MKSINQHTLLTALQGHIGRENGVRVEELAAEAMGISPLLVDEVHERDVRETVAALRREGHHICALPRSGYYIAANEQELNATCEFLYDRALTSLAQVAAMKRVSLPDLRGQLRLPT